MSKMHDNIRLYHVDHLGSTSLVTDIDGEITQHVAYIPYGEVFVEQRNGVWNTPYLFNAKELDEETGLYYYGARYLDPTNVAWLSVDPLFEKYVGMSPYNYCVGNPVKLVDVDGMKFTDAMEEMAQQEEKYADKRIDENSTKLEKRGERKFFISKIKNNRLRNEISRYEEAKKEIAEMRASDQMYDFQTYYRAPGTDYDKNGLPYDRHYGGYVSYDQDKEVFIINLNSYEGINIGDFAHELKHGYQFETGRLSMKGKTTSGMANGGYLYDYTDEIEAHQRGADFGSSLPVHPDPNVYSKLPREERNADDIYKWAVKFYKGKGTEFDHEIYKH
ncbi:MAG: hypothetical protein J5554_13100 [Paludibacteraceae bacterium]|nr:hypothetical protein [Paludibacteraceae bacterium]